MDAIPDRYGTATLIAENPQARVYKCLDKKRGNDVALKLWKSTDEDIRQNVLNQFNLLSKVDFPFIIKASDTGITEDKLPFLTTEWVEGGNLSGKSATYSLGEETNVLLQTAQALDFLHSLGYIHGDIKPSNVLFFRGDSGELQIKLTDFEFLSPGSYISSDSWQGTPGYMAPEILRGEPATYSSDLYSLGVLLFELLTERLPFEADTVYRMAFAQLDSQAEFTQREREVLPFILTSCAEALLQKNSVDRMNSAWELRNVILHDSDKVLEADKQLGYSLIDFMCKAKLTEQSTHEFLHSYLSRIFHGTDRDGKFSAYIIEKSGGEKSLINSLLRALVSNQLLRRVAGTWKVSEELAEYKVSQSLAQECVLSDSATLDLYTRQILEALAILKLPVKADILCEIAEVPPGTFKSSLHDLKAAGWLTTGQDESIRFSKGVYGDYFVQQLSSEQISRLRKKSIQVLQEELADEKYPELFAELLSQALRIEDSGLILLYASHLVDLSEKEGEKPKAIRYAQIGLKYAQEEGSDQAKLTLKLADLYNDSGQPTEAVGYYSQYLHLNTATSEVTADVQRKLGMCCARLLHFDDAFKNFDSAMEYYQLHGIESGIVEILLDSAAAKRIQGDYSQAAQLLGHCTNLLKTLDDPSLLARLLNLQGILDWHRGCYDSAFNRLRKSYDLYATLNMKREHGRVASNLGLLLRDLGRPEEALVYLQKDLLITQEQNDLVSLSASYNNLGLAHKSLRRFDEAVECFDQALKLSYNLSYREGVAHAYNNLGFVFISMGSLDKALFNLREAVGCFKEIEKPSGQAVACFNLAEIYRIRKLTELALQHYHRSIELRKALGERIGVADCLAGITRIYLENQELDKAESYFAEAIAFYHEVGKIDDATLLYCSKAEALCNIKRTVEAELMFENTSNKVLASTPLLIQSYVKMVSGLISINNKDFESAERNLLDALKGFTIERDKVAQAKVNAYLGAAYSAAGRDRLALRHWRESLGIYRDLKVDKDIERLSKIVSAGDSIMTSGREQVRTLAKVSQFLMQIEDEEELLFEALRAAIELLGAERGAIILYDETRQIFELSVASGLESQTAKDAIDISSKTVKEVYASGNILIAGDAQSEPTLKSHESIRTYNILSILCAPLRVQDKVVGTLYLDNRQVIRAFADDDKDFIDALSNLISIALLKARSFERAHEEIQNLKQLAGVTYSFPDVIGKSPQMQELFAMVSKAAPTKAAVLILGENGTGKEIIANLIHKQSERRDKSFIRVNCAAIPRDLLEAELFGHEKGAFTGAHRSKPGRFEIANQGTIFLDEIGDMPLELQSKLLQVLEQHEFIRVGGTQTIKVDVRIIAATNRDLSKLIEANLFRQDLYYRLNTITIVVPPLRERKEDIPSLIEFFINKFTKENEKPPVKMPPQLLQALCECDWPGNVRQLMNTIERGVIFSESDQFDASLLPVELVQEIRARLGATRKYGKLQDLVEKYEKQIITGVLKKTSWNQSKASRILAIPVSSLNRKIMKYGLKKPRSLKPF
jgi:Nif-specific regulatory protein